MGNYYGNGMPPAKGFGIRNQGRPNFNSYNSNINQTYRTMDAAYGGDSTNSFTTPPIREDYFRIEKEQSEALRREEEERKRRVEEERRREEANRRIREAERQIAEMKKKLDEEQRLRQQYREALNIRNSTIVDSTITEDSADENSICKICYDRKINAAFSCGHPTCYECGLQSLDSFGCCPSCRRKDVTVMRLYF